MAKNSRDLLITNVKEISKLRGSNLTKKQIEEVFVILKEAVAKTVITNDGELSIDFPGLLSIKKVFVPSQERTNPKTGEKFMDTDKYTVKIKASNSIKTRIKDETNAE